MSRRSAPFIAVLILLMVAGAVSWGCGGEEATTTSSNAAVTTTTFPGGGGSDGGTNELLNTRLKTTPDTPSEYVEAVKQGRPVVLLFYVSGSVDDGRVLESLNRLQPNFTDYVFLLYDYRTPNAYGDLSTLLKV